MICCLTLPFHYFNALYKQQYLLIKLLFYSLGWQLAQWPLLCFQGCHISIQLYSLLAPTSSPCEKQSEDQYSHKYPSFASLLSSQSLHTAEA